MELLIPHFSAKDCMLVSHYVFCFYNLYVIVSLN